MRAYGLDTELKGEPAPELVDDSHPYIHVDMTRCIDCFRCERICHELQGQYTWHAVERGGAAAARPRHRGHRSARARA